MTVPGQNELHVPDYYLKSVRKISSNPLVAFPYRIQLNDTYYNRAHTKSTDVLKNKKCHNDSTICDTSDRFHGLYRLQSFV